MRTWTWRLRLLRLSLLLIPWTLTKTKAGAVLDHRLIRVLSVLPELYGTPTAVEQAHANGNAANGVAATTKKRTVVHLSLCDAIPGYGPIADMTFALAKNGVRRSFSVLYPLHSTTLNG